MKSKNEQEKIGFVVVDDAHEYIWGYGETSEDAWEMVEDERDGEWDDDQFERLECYETTSSLWSDVVDGNSSSFSIYSNIAMTWEEREDYH